MHTTTERTSWGVLILLCIAQFIVILDITVVNVALPTIGSDLDFAPNDLQWVVTAYLLLTGGLLLLGGRTADILGGRPVFLAGLSIFTAASLGSGLAESPSVLVTMRAAQGLGAALLLPAALSIVTTTYVGAQRTKALSIWGAIGGAGAALGLVLGGMFTTWLSWEWIFFINIPVGLAVAGPAVRFLPRPAPKSSRRPGFDVPGAVSVVAGLAVLVYALEGTAEHGWGSTRTLVLLVLATALLAVFISVERSIKSPLVPPETWRNRSLISSAVVMFGATGLLIGTFFLNSIYQQHVLGTSALTTGLQFVPLALAIALATHATAHLLSHVGSRTVAAAGLALMAVGALVLTAAPDHARYASDLLPGFIAIGLGVGLVFPAVSVTAMNDVGPNTAGLASGLMTTAHEVGAAVGVAVLSAVAAGTGELAESDGFAAGYGDGFLVAALIAAALLLVSLRAVPSVRPAEPLHGAIH
ncbi:MAG: MFS transporter [Actinomycetota bacterium]|nr:MFS transporter [Actinomycetota bacterium]